MYQDTVLKLALRLSFARDEREKPYGVSRQRLLSGVQRSSGEVSCSLGNDELVEACEASLLQSIEEEQLRLSQVPRSDAGSRCTPILKRRRSFREGQEFD